MLVYVPGRFELGGWELTIEVMFAAVVAAAGSLVYLSRRYFDNSQWSSLYHVL